MAPFKRRRILGRSFAALASSREQREKALAKAPGLQTAPSPGNVQANTRSPAISSLFSSTHLEGGHQAALFFVFSRTLARFGTIPTPQPKSPQPQAKKPPSHLAKSATQTSRNIRDPITQNPKPASLRLLSPRRKQNREICNP